MVILNKNKINVFLSGAIGCYGDDYDKYKGWRNETFEFFRIENKDIYCIDPTKYYDYNTNDHLSDKEVMRFFLHTVKKSDVILVNLKDINKSIGACQEILCAYLHDIPIIGFTEDEDEIIYNWIEEQCTRIERGKNAMFKAIEHISLYYG